MREMAACVLGSLPEPEALAALSQALSRSTDDDWTRLLLLAIGSAKNWDDDDAFSLDGQPYAVTLPIGLTLTIHFTIADDIVRAQVEGFLAAPLSYPVREAAAFALRHSLEHGDVRSAFLEAARGQRDVEHQHGARLDVGDAGRRLAELYGTVAAEQLGAALVDEPDPDGVPPDLRAAAAHPQYKVRAGVHRGKLADPDVLEDPEDGELALLVDQCIVRQDREIDVQLRSP
jgi:hypothetical protein